MDSVSILLINALAYTFILLHFYRNGKLSLGFILWLAYTISAWSSYLFVQQPLYFASIHNCEIEIFPCIYLLVLLYLCMRPLVHINKIPRIEITNEKGLRYLLFVCVFIQALLFVVDIPQIIRVLTSPMELADIRTAAYGRDGESVSNIASNPFLNRLSLFYSGVKPIAIGLSMYLLFMYNRQRTLIKIFAITTFLFSLRTIIITAGRGETVITLSIYFCVLFLIRDALSLKLKRMLTLYAIPIIVISATFFWAVTISRFGDSATFFMYKYMGEPMNNFCGILFDGIKGYTEGKAQFSYVYRYLLGDSGFENTVERYELMENTNQIPAFIFYTFIGPLVMEFGKTIPIFIVFFLNQFAYRIVSKKRNVHLGIIATYIAAIYFYIYGVFSFPIGNFTGLSMIVFLIILYRLFGKRLNVVS